MVQAERDLEKARLDREHGYHEWACFTAHQAAEKALKAVVQRRGSSARGHSLLRLLEAVGSEEDNRLHAARVLDRYYIQARYPNGFPSGAPLEHFDEVLSREAVDAADTIVRFCRDQLG